MMQTLVECVPNFSEGRDERKVRTIVEALLAGPDVYLLDQEMDADHNRCVITLVGTRESIGEAALRGIGKAAELIDLTIHQGAHPRIGATDVVPFVPISGVTLEDCVRIAAWVAEETWSRFRIPTYLYEAAAQRPDRKNLETIRRGQFEKLREEVRSNPDRRPDFGEAALHPTAGATVVGARKFLIAYNINLHTPSVAIARAIARKIRTSSGGLPCVKAMGVELKGRKLAQVSMNLTDFETTSIGTVFEAVAREAAGLGVAVAGSEIVGLVPRRALVDAAAHLLRLKDFRADAIIEDRLARALAEEAPRTGQPETASLSRLVEEFLLAVAAPTPTPGGGSVAAFIGALAAALGEMVACLALRHKSEQPQVQVLEASRASLDELRRRLSANIARDAASYEAVMAALRLPAATEPDKASRARAVEEARKTAALIPLETAEFAAEVGRLIAALRPITPERTSSDLAVAAFAAEAAARGALENVRANLPSIHDPNWMAGAEERIRRLRPVHPHGS